MDEMSSDCELGDESGDYTPEESCSGVSEICQSTEQQFGIIREDVIAQQKAIESFIKRSENSDRLSDSLAILQSLFSLFQATVSQNTALQEELRCAKAGQLQLQEKLDSVAKRLQKFMFNTTKLTHERVTSLDEVLNVIQKQNMQVCDLMQTIEQLQMEKEMISSQMRICQQKAEEESVEEMLEMTQLRSRAEIAEKEASQLSDQLSALRESNSSLEQSIVQAEESENQHRWEMKKKNEQLEKTVNELEQLKNEHMQQLQSSQQTVTNLKTKLASVRNKLKTLRDTIQTLEGEKQTLSTQILEAETKAKAQTQKYRKKLKALQREIVKKRGTESELDQLNKQIINVKKEHQQALVDIQNRSNENQNEIGELLGQQENLRRENHKLRQTLRASSREQHRLESENSQLIVTVQHLKLEIDVMKRSLETVDDSNIPSHDPVYHEYDNTPLQETHELMQGKISSLERELSQLRKNLSDD